MLHCTNYLSSQQFNHLSSQSFQQFNHSQQKENNEQQSWKEPQPGRGAFPSFGIPFLPTKRTISSGVARRFVSIGQARTEKTICVNYPEAGAEKSGTAAQQRNAEKQRSRKAP
jgi:hypothetical protein